jgi:hypothetical protein
MTTTDINRALKRLAASDTPRKRNNALKAFAGAIKKLETAVDAEYPKLRSNGTAIVKRKSRGTRCPLCKVPMKSHKVLAVHLRKMHNIGRFCVCGKDVLDKRDGGTSIRSLFTSMARHLAGVGDLRQHFAEAAIDRAARLI